MPPTSTEQRLEEQVRQVVNWRFEQLLDAGYPPRTAKRLSEHPNVDLHEARQLLKRGATVREAIRILL